ncbi:DUF998 domain-containing protein [Amycolatopsis acididurans]|uniref:DUF998 domain-containing protein n=1 Tax=Amycolatopsis acididurans TaxID=2724524 RepID=UPI0028A6681E|nr:DUF998 domain-containing protein [Amycolatopsis acididurans]
MSIATAALAWAAFTMTVLHLISSHDPLTDTLSSYAFTDRGTGMLGASILATAIGSLATLAALSAAGIAVSGTSRALFGTWSLGLGAAALFPASYPEHPNPVSGEIHQYSCVIAFLSLPALGFSLLDTLPSGRRAVRGISAGATLMLLLFGIGYALPWLLPVGFVQRLALIVDVALICSLIVIARRNTSAGPGGIGVSRPSASPDLDPSFPSAGPL